MQHQNLLDRPHTIFLYSYLTSEKDEDEHILPKECVMHVWQSNTQGLPNIPAVSLWVPLASWRTKLFWSWGAEGCNFNKTIKLGQKYSEGYNSDRDSASSSWPLLFELGGCGDVEGGDSLDSISSPKILAVTFLASSSRSTHSGTILLAP